MTDEQVIDFVNGCTSAQIPYLSPSEVDSGQIIPRMNCILKPFEKEYFSIQHQKQAQTTNQALKITKADSYGLL